MSYHGAMSDLALQNMTAARRRDLQNAARLLAGAADLSTERLARLLGEAQGGAPFAPDFEADLLVIATRRRDAAPRPDRARRAPGRPDRSGWPGGRAGRLPARRGPAACCRCRCPAAPSRDPHRGAPVSAGRGRGTRRNRQVAPAAPGAAAVLLRAAADGGALSRAYLVDLASGRRTARPGGGAARRWRPPAARRALP